MKKLLILILIAILFSSCATTQVEKFDPRKAASETGVDISLLPNLGTATSLDKIVTYDQSVIQGERITGVLFSGDANKFFDGIGGWQILPKNNSSQWVFVNLDLAESPFDWVRVSSNVSWGDAYILCDSAETTSPLEFDIYRLEGISDTPGTKLTAETSELTMSITNQSVDAIDLSSFPDLNLGDFLNVRVSVVANTAIKCTVALELIER